MNSSTINRSQYGNLSIQSNGLKNRPLSAATFKGIYSKKPKDSKLNIDSFMNTHAGSIINPNSLNDDQSVNQDTDRFNRNNVYHEIVKKRPQIAKVDKEKLYEESIQLNRQVEKLRNDQQQLLKELQRVENEKIKYQKLISEVETYVDKKKGQKISLKESWLVINLKKQLQNLKNDIQYKKSVVIDLKRDPFTTQKQEHEIFVKVYQEIAEQYRVKTKQLQKQNSQKVTNNKVDNATDNNQEATDNSFNSNSNSSEVKAIELECEFKILQNQNEEFECQQSIIERKVAHTLIQLSQCKEELKEKEKDIEYLKEEIQRMIEKEKKNKEINSKINTFKLKNQNKNGEEIRQRKNSELERMKDPSYQLLKEKDIQIEENYKKITQLKQTLQEITNFEINSKNELNDELNHLKQVFNTLEAKYEQLNQEADEFNNQIPLENFPKLGYQFQITNNILQKQDGKPQVKVPKVTSFDIKVIAHEIKLRLTLKAIPIVEAVKKLFSQEVRKNSHVTIDEMRERLQMSPFSIKVYDEALLFARYLVEDNQEEFLYLDLNRSSNYRVIRSIFKTSIGQINIIDEETEKIKWKQLSLKITQFQQGLQETSNMYSKTGILSSEYVQRCLEETLNEIDQEEIDYVLMRMFEATNNYKRLNMELMFEIFNVNNWKSRSQRKELYQVYLEDGVQIDDEIDRFPTEINNSMMSNQNENEVSPNNLNNMIIPLSQFKYL
ncbi:hypothetical protein TTHERM_00294910 (macronuclear) [Tetrahymena thermophila SB210]|uniref:Uncharacterized protein n=1 Tax=Tetrahymena thermophila (strain SB210) TaxID=312017 RepID=I7LUE1_TETTS|nr:hypothetical protein TTHERM_00294910 [Tetrahymena thermophila SB210]EAR92878.2 hypothetical protein TTHERM_00294910 [Tetrahymena thermophila SB210]|eukprot:XP_001013123.2 hypothetical protein TTHERM_00294910 [Tetrahymena thermophila SB210]